MSFLNALKFLPKEEVLGVQQAGDHCLYARLTRTSKGIKLENLDTVKPLDISLAASVFPSSKTLVRPVDLALIKAKEIDLALPFELEPHLPFPIEKCEIDKICLEKAEGVSHLQTFCASKADIQNHIDELQTYGIDPEIICPKALCLAHFSSLFYPDNRFQIIIDVDEAETTLLFMHQGKPLIARSHPVGLSTLRKSGELTEESLPELHGYLRELARVLLSFEQHPQAEQNLKLLFTGQIVKEPMLCTLISTFLQHAEDTLTPTPQTISVKEGTDYQKIRLFAAPIGAALSDGLLKKEMLSANFRKGDFASNNLWKRYRPEFVGYYVLMCAIAFALYFLGKIELTKHNRELVEKYSSLLVTLEKPVPEELEFITPIDIEDALFAIEPTLKTTGDELALHPDIPRVSDLLNWLSNHPNISVTITEQQARVQEPLPPMLRLPAEQSETPPPLQVPPIDKKTEHYSLQLESLNYVMVKRPEKGKAKEPYQIRVDLEFSSPSATLAREFHDALLSPNPFVDPKNELKWTVQRGRYRASFFLKDKTQYPHTIQGTHASS